RRNEGGDHIYFNNSSENNDVVDLTQGNNSDDYSSSDKRSEYDSDGENNDSEDENKHENENYNIREEDEDN
ncbi:16421_t:CDS:1, partial [Gigaspora margarita]